MPPVTKVVAPAAPGGGGGARGAPPRKRPRVGGLGPLGRPPRAVPDRPVVGLVRPVATGAVGEAGEGGPPQGVPSPGEAVEVRLREAGYLGGWVRGRVLQVAPLLKLLESQESQL